MTEVTTAACDLQTNVSQTISGTAKIFPVLTYVLGLGLTSEAKTNLDAMANAGGTATTSGHAYYADEPDELTTALETIMVNLLGQVSSGSAISILSRRSDPERRQHAAGRILSREILWDDSHNLAGLSI